MSLVSIDENELKPIATEFIENDTDQGNLHKIQKRNLLIQASNDPAQENIKTKRKRRNLRVETNIAEIEASSVESETKMYFSSFINIDSRKL